MLDRFGSNILKKSLFGKKHKLLLATSGGVDSVVLAHLLREGGFNFSIAHCNFQLRGKDSTDDELFCKTLAQELDIPFFVKQFNTKQYAREHKLSIQMAARDLRYAWFGEVLKANRFDFVLTAHHSGDVLETVFINLLRGTGIKGLKGIPEKNGTIVRPLLSFTKEEIISYATEKEIAFRLDKSNLEDKYERNFLRLNIIPGLKKLNPDLERTFLENGSRFMQEDAIVTDFLKKKAKVLTKQNANRIVVDKLKLQQEAYGESILHFLLTPYGFNHTQQKNILENISTGAIAGKVFFSPAHRLAISKTQLVIEPNKEAGFDALTINSLEELNEQAIFKVEKLKAFGLPAKHELIVKPGSLIFPLTIRAKQTGDKFRPFGMKGFKLVSDLFKEEKLNTFEKEDCRLLVNGNGEIIWVAGYRSDERYKVNKSDIHLLKLSIID